MGLEAFANCGIFGEAVTRDHMAEFTRSMNLELGTWANRGVRRWAVDLQTINLVIGQMTYVGTAQGVPPETASIIDMYYSLVNGVSAGVNQDRIMLSMSSEDYDEIPNKAAPGTPTRYLFQKVIPRQIIIWQPAQIGAPAAVCTYRRLRRLQDANPQNGETPDVDNLYLDALGWSMSARMAWKFAPERLDKLELKAKAAWAEAAIAGREDANVTIMPNLSAYYRR